MRRRGATEEAAEAWARGHRWLLDEKVGFFFGRGSEIVNMMSTSSLIEPEPLNAV